MLQRVMPETLNSVGREAARGMTGGYGSVLGLDYVQNSPSGCGSGSGRGGASQMRFLGSRRSW